MIPALMIVTLAPLCVELLPVSYNTAISGTFYNYSHPVVEQAFEVRYLPALAVLLLLVSVVVLRFRKRDAVLWSKVFFAAGMGAAGFSFFRMVLFHAFRDDLVWLDTWEELTELLYVLGVAAILWVFHETLFADPASALAPANVGKRTEAR
jgi:hypothetical protein